MKKRALAVCALALTGCVGDGVEFGGVAMPVTLPAQAIDCDDAQAAGLMRVERGRIKIPDEVILFFLASENFQSIHRMVLEYDVTPEGRAANIRYAGPPEYLKHATRQKLVRVAADLLATSRFSWSGDPAYATKCAHTIDFIVDWKRAPDGGVDSEDGT